MDFSRLLAAPLEDPAGAVNVLNVAFIFRRWSDNEFGCDLFAARTTDAT